MTDKLFPLNQFHLRVFNSITIKPNCETFKVSKYPRVVEDGVTYIKLCSCQGLHQYNIQLAKEISEYLEDNPEYEYYSIAVKTDKAVLLTTSPVINGFFYSVTRDDIRKSFKVIIKCVNVD